MKVGEDKLYIFDPQRDYGLQSLRELSPYVVQTSYRQPPVSKLEELFSQGKLPLKKIGILVFESQIQPTRGGLSGKNLVYLSESGKQILTENMLKIWEEGFRFFGKDFNYLPTSIIKKARSFSQYGVPEEDHILTKRSQIAPDDIFFIESGKKTTTVTVVNPRGMRDMSFLLVPAYELMGGPKWSEHNKHFVNDVAKELGLDAVLIISSEISWTSSHIDKHSGQSIPEEMKLALKSSLLLPLHRYHQALDVLGISRRPQVSLCYRSYETQVNLPVELIVAEDKRNFETIEKGILNPLFKIYNDLTQMMIVRILEDTKKTW